MTCSSKRIVTVLGGYGIFGARVAEALAHDPRAHLRIAGRNPTIGRNLAHRLEAEFVACCLDDADSLASAIDGSHIVIHAAGPFQGTDYGVAEACLRAGAHYLDLADGRDFVAGIGQLDSDARRAGLFITSGASSTPAVTSALIESLLVDFSAVDEIHTALSPGNQNPRGASTIGAILSYLGRSVSVWNDGRWTKRPAWGNGHWREFPAPVGWRRVYSCDVPELALFPARFKAATVRFSAGLELNALNRLLSLVARPARWFHLDLAKHARLFLKLSLILYPLGTTNGSLAIWIKGRDQGGQPAERRIALVTDYDGPATPSCAAILLARRILASGPPCVGAHPCVGYLSLQEIVDHLRPLGVWCTRGDASGWNQRTEACDAMLAR